MHIIIIKLQFCHTPYHRDYSSSIEAIALQLPHTLWSTQFRSFHQLICPRFNLVVIAGESEFVKYYMTNMLQQVSILEHTLKRFHCMNETLSHLRSKEFQRIHKPRIPHHRDTSQCTPVYIEMHPGKVVVLQKVKLLSSKQGLRWCGS